MYFWALVSALGTFWLGAGVSMRHSIEELINPTVALDKVQYVYVCRDYLSCGTIARTAFERGTASLGHRCWEDVRGSGMLAGSSQASSRGASSALLTLPLPYPSLRACVPRTKQRSGYTCSDYTHRSVVSCMWLADLGRWGWKCGPCSGLACSSTATCW